MWRKHPIAMVAAIALLVPAALGLYFSFHYLPPISESPPPPHELDRRGQNWVGQGAAASFGDTALLLLTIYWVKRIILTRCARRWTAVYFYFLSIVILPSLRLVFV